VPTRLFVQAGVALQHLDCMFITFIGPLLHSIEKR